MEEKRVRPAHSCCDKADASDSHQSPLLNCCLNPGDVSVRRPVAHAPADANDTIVIWGGEFGRTPMVQGGNDGRDHHNRAFTMWLAGGGIKAGHVHGKTDDFGFNVVEDPVHVHDLNATLLHLLGFDHTRLTYRFQGRDYRLTDVHGNLVKGILA